jgi:hypothetical protein
LDEDIVPEQTTVVKESHPCKEAANSCCPELEVLFGMALGVLWKLLERGLSNHVKKTLARSQWLYNLSKGII